MDLRAKQLIGNFSATLEEVTALLKEQLEGKLIFESWRTTTDTKVVLLIFEYYYIVSGGAVFSNSESSSLTIMLTQNPDYQTADLVGSGHGGRMFSEIGQNWSHGLDAEKILYRNGFSNYR